MNLLVFLDDANSDCSLLQYGPIVDIDLKVPPRPPGYAFVEVASKLNFFIVLYFLFLFYVPGLALILVLWNRKPQFEDPRDAEDAIDGRDGYDFDGHRLRVSLVVFLFCIASSTSCMYRYFLTILYIYIYLFIRLSSLIEEADIQPQPIVTAVGVAVFVEPLGAPTIAVCEQFHGLESFVAF